MSKRFLVYVQERWERVEAVEAEDGRDAKLKIYNGGGVEVSCNPVYVEDLPVEYWQAEECHETGEREA